MDFTNWLNAKRKTTVIVSSGIQEARNMKPDGTAKEPKVREPKGKGKGKKSKRQ